MGEEQQVVSLVLQSFGTQFSILPEERYRDKEGAERSRYIFSKRVYFPTLIEALDYIKKDVSAGLYKFVE